jgi:hypothetical protein
VEIGKQHLLEAVKLTTNTAVNENSSIKAKRKQVQLLHRPRYWCSFLLHLFQCSFFCLSVILLFDFNAYLFLELQLVASIFVLPTSLRMNVNSQFESRTKSSNQNVLDVYDYILNDQAHDNDVWIAGGNSMILGKLEKYASSDWAELESDIHNWTDLQLQILGRALSDNGIDTYVPTENNIEYYRAKIFMQVFLIIDFNDAPYLIDLDDFQIQFLFENNHFSEIEMQKFKVRLNQINNITSFKIVPKLLKYL